MCLLGLGGLASDVATFQQLMKFRTNLYKLKEGREMKASTLAQVVAIA